MIILKYMDTWNSIQNCLGKSNIRQNEGSLHQLDLNLRKKLVKCYIWSRVLYGAETYSTSESRSEIAGKFWNLVLEKDGGDQLDRLCEKWISIKSIKEDRNILHTILRENANWIGHIMHKTCLIKHAIEGKIEVPGKWGRRHKLLLDDLKEMRRYWELKEKGLEHTLWQTTELMNEANSGYKISTSSATLKSTMTIPSNFDCTGS